MVGDEYGLFACEAAVSVAAGDFAGRVPQHACRLDAILLLQHVHQPDLHMVREFNSVFSEPPEASSASRHCHQQRAQSLRP